MLKYSFPSVQELKEAMNSLKGGMKSQKMMWGNVPVLWSREEEQNRMNVEM